MGFFRFSQPGAFIQDSWRVNATLSLEFGLRWEWLQPWYTQANNMANFVPGALRPVEGGHGDQRRAAWCRVPATSTTA